MSFARLLPLALLLTGCLTDLENPCDEYVDYMCACHDGDSGFDCDNAANVYTGETLDEQNLCEDELDAQVQRDAEDTADTCEG